jgi:hypothetical protein
MTYLRRLSVTLICIVSNLFFYGKGVIHTSCVEIALKHVIEGKTEARVEATGRRGRSSKQLLGDLKEARG